MAPGLVSVSQLSCITTPVSKKHNGEFLNKSIRENFIKNVWRHADAVCFDVDSTICQDEAIDELANFLGVAKEVERITQQAMNGLLTFREALKSRLEIMKPSVDLLNEFIKANPIRLTEGIKDLVDDLHERKVDVYIVTGGFQQLVLPVAELLNVPFSNVFANELLFDKEGNYIGFDTSKLTSDSGSKNVGKAGVCGFLKKSYGYKNLVMVGDGATDMEASPPADAFIGFAGNQLRESVYRKCGWMVYNFDTLRKNLL